MARKREQKYKISFIVKTINEYVDNAKYPDIISLQEICSIMGWSYKYLQNIRLQNEDVKLAIERLTTKKAYILEKGMLEGAFSPTAAIFSLKQLGWKDNPTVDEVSESEEEDELSQALKNFIKKAKNDK